MGKIFANIELVNTEDLLLWRRGTIIEDEVRRMPVRILVDTGAYSLALNESIVQQLGLRKITEQIFELADGSHQRYDIVGPVEIRFKNRDTTTRAVMLPGSTEPLLGRIPLEDMDVVLLPREETIDVNPDSPLIAKKDLK
jgi:clan AA aspartic protease